MVQHLTLGGSGTAVTLGAALLKQVLVEQELLIGIQSKTATFTAVSWRRLFCNTSGGAFTCNLPAGSAGAYCILADYAKLCKQII